MSPTKHARACDLDVTLRSRTIVAVMLWSIAILTFLSVAGQVAKHYFGHPYVFGLVEYFNLNNESNPPTYYQSLALLVTAVVSGAVAVREKKLQSDCWRQWAGIALLFVYLSADEGAAIHEATIPFFYRFARVSSGMWSPGWEFYALPLVATVGALYFRFFFVYLSPGERLTAMAAAILYVGGAVGMEMASAAIVFSQGYDPHHRDLLIHAVMAHTEEIMEMLAVVLFIRVPLGRLERGTRLHLAFGSSERSVPYLRELPRSGDRTRQSRSASSG